MALSNISAFAYSDVTSTLEKTAVALVEGLGIMDAAEEDKFGSGAYITKGEFAVAVANMMQLDVVEGKMGNSVFADVDIATKEGCAINLLADTGVIPTTDKTYKPTDIITYGEAARMVINSLGYGYEVTLNGGYPGGVIKVAAQLKLASGISATTSTQLTRIDTAIVLYNALMTETIDVTLTGGSAEYTKSGETMLEDVWDVYYDYGTILGVGLTSLDGVSLSETQVSVSGEVMECTIPNIKDYLGYSVKAYYMDDSKTGDTTLVAVVPRSTDNKVEIINADDLYVSGNSVRYEENGKMETVYVEDDPQVIYNGRLYDDYKNLEEVLDIAEGNVTFISNTGSKYAGIIIVEEEKHILVERVDTKNNVVYAVNSTEENADPYLASALDLDDEDKDIYITLNGADAAVSDIQINDVLVVTETADGEEVNVRIDRNVIEGKIGAVDVEEGEIRIEGASYTLSAYAMGDFMAGNSGTFAATADGKVLGIIATKTSNLKYAYVLSVTHEVNEEKAYVKLFTQDGELKMFVVNEKTVVNGKKTLFNEVKNVIAEGDFISFKLNSDGNISQMNRPYDTSSNPDYYSESSFIKNWSKSSVRYVGGIMGRSIANEDTTIFYIPRYDRDVDTDYRILKLTDLKSGTVYSDVTCYDVDRNGRIGALVIKEDIKEKVESDSNLFFVDKVLTSVDEDGEDIVEVQGFEKGAAKTLYFNTKTESVTYEDGWMNYVGNESFDTGYNSELPGSNLRGGDAIQYALAADGTVGAYRIIYNNAEAIYTSGDLTYDDDKYYYERWSKAGNVTKLDFNDDLYIGLGKVDIRYNDFMCFCALNEEERTHYKNSIVDIVDYYRPFNLVQENTYIYTYNVDSKRVELGTMEDIAKNDTVFVRSVEMGELNEIMVYIEG